MEGLRPVKQPKTLICVPTYNERENLPLLVDAIFAEVPDVEILVIDDNSPDGTGQLADEIASKNSKVHVLHRAGKQGLGKAYIAGFREAMAMGAERIFEMDADLSHDASYLPHFLRLIDQGADLVLGSRYVKGGGVENWGISRKVISRGGCLYAQAILGLPLRDLTGGFKCFRRRVLEAIDLDAIDTAGYGFQIEMTYRVYKMGFKVVELPIIFVDRKVGESKMSNDIVLEAMTNVWKLRFSRVPARRPA